MPKSILSEVSDMQTDIIGCMSDEQLRDLHKEINQRLSRRVDELDIDEESKKAFILLSHDHMLYESMLINALIKYRK